MDASVWETCVFVSGFSREECASWVQVWASVAAILGSAFTVHRVHRLEVAQRDRDAHIAYTRFLQGLNELVAAAVANAEYVEAVMVELGPKVLAAIDHREDRPEVRAALDGRFDKLQMQQTTVAFALRQIDLQRIDRQIYLQAWMSADMYVREMDQALTRARHAEFYSLDIAGLQRMAFEYGQLLTKHLAELEDGIARRVEVVSVDNAD